MKNYKLTAEKLLALPIGTELYDGFINSKTILTSISQKEASVTTVAIGATVASFYDAVESTEWLLTAPISVTDSLEKVNYSRRDEGLPPITQEEVWPTLEEYPAYLFLQKLKGF